VSVDQGSVTVDGTKITEETQVGAGSTVATQEGRAKVSLYGAIAIMLDPNTEIVLSDINKMHPQVLLKSGQTWNHFLKTNGVTAYTIATSDTRANVVGTFFGMNPMRVQTVEGRVNVEDSGMVFDVAAGQVLDTSGAQPVLRQATGTEQRLSKSQLQEQIDALRQQRSREIAAHQALFDQLKSQFNVTDQQVTEALRQADEGQLNIDNLLGQLPVAPPVVARVADITKAIQRLVALARS